MLQRCRDPASGPSSLTCVAVPVVTNASPRDNGPMVSTAAERQARRRARLRAGETLPACTLCGAKLLLDQRQRQDRQGDGLCWSCWVKSPAGQAAERERAARARRADPERIRELARERAKRFRAKQAGAAGG